MTGLIFGQYWIILFLWVGLAVTRRYISRYPNLAIILVLARSFFRIVVLQNESAGDRTFSSLLASEWLIVVLNFIAIVALLAEMIAGHRCWRLRIIRARKRRKKRAAGLEIVREKEGELDLLKNIYGQFHTWFQSVGMFIIADICYYLVEHDSTDWTWKGLIVSAAAALLTYGFTHDDHKKTEKAVQKEVERAVITTQEVLEKKGEI
jgi:sterol desaturase/sphingolipid hydroxylase (fatty acid hydroxylase superfamily)